MRPPRAVCLALLLGSVLLWALACGAAQTASSATTTATVDAAQQRIEQRRPPTMTPPSGTPDAAAASPLVDGLRARGVQVREIGPSGADAEPFLRTLKIEYVVGGATLYVLPFPSEAEAQTAAGRVPPDADNGIWDWARDVEFYRCGRAIALQAGREPDVSRVLSSLCGPPFAVGRRRF